MDKRKKKLRPSDRYWQQANEDLESWQASFYREKEADTNIPLGNGATMKRKML